MKICFTTYRGNMYCGGQGIYSYYLTQSLARLGHEVHLVSGPPYPEKPEGVTLHKIPNQNFFEKGNIALRNLSPKKIFHPLNIYEWIASRFGNLPELLGFSLRMIQTIPSLHKKVGFDVIHDNQCIGYGFLATRLLGIPQVATIHHPLSIDREKSIREGESLLRKVSSVLYYPLMMQKISLRAFDRIITVSKNSFKEIRKRFRVPEGDIRIIRNGVDEELFRNSLKNRELEPESEAEGTSKKYKQMSDPPTPSFLFVGETENPHKGFRLLAQALRLLKDKGVEAKLRVVNGNSPNAEGAKDIVHKLGLENWVEFLGKLPALDLVEEYSMATATVLPSLHEGFGLPAIESMSCETPVIATTAGALPEIVSNDTGILVPPRNDVKLAEAMQKMLENSDEREKIGRIARKRVKNRYTWKKAAMKVTDVYREVTEKC